MTNSEIFEAPLKNINDNIDKLPTETFYSPLCIKGYLTPLQRKKLREKRCSLFVDFNDSNEEKLSKKARKVKRKRDYDSSLHDKVKVGSKKIKTKDSIQKVQCSVSKIVHKASTDSMVKKFFKSPSSDRLEKANFTMPLVLKKNVFLDINKSIKEIHSRTRNTNIQENNKSSSHISQNEQISRKSNLSLLEDDSSEQISLLEQDDSIFKFNWPSDDELLKRQERARAVSRKSVLREAYDVQECSDIENNKQNTEGNQMKFYPIFHTTGGKQLRTDNIKKNQNNENKKIKSSSKGGEQMIIDAGQKDIGAKICSTCNMIYTVAHEEDEQLHLNYHHTYLISVKFPGWKEENVIGEYCDGRIIMIRRTDKSFKVKKVEDILQLANRDLGFSSPALPTKSELTFLLFISKDKQVTGCLVAEPISKGFKVLLAGNESSLKETSLDGVWKIGNWYASSEAFPAICGINRIWVAHNFRRCRVASRMIDCLRGHFIHGHVIDIHELAFTDPSPDGREFAATYTGTNNFLVYK